ncbi:GntR family transcriptional regulator [Bacillus sp. JJ1562]|uniref:GntR family transcriptional regulator n=1 Tax=Bacillus sp. JJ1562 TaxID=3122960 RepID=UPI0030019A5F
MDPLTYIKDAIITGKYEPGKRLTEESLAKELNISRTPIREAIKQLESDGLITPLKRGVIVRNFTKKDIQQIYDLRALLESYAAGQAAYYRNDMDVQKMIGANIKYGEIIDLQAGKPGISRVYEIVKVNQEFHEAILKASRNEHLRFHISKVVVVPLVFRSFYWYDTNEMKRSLEVHKTILQAIQNRESERAKIAMQEHIYLGRDHVLKHLDDIKEELSKGETYD